MRSCLDFLLPGNFLIGGHPGVIGGERSAPCLDVAAKWQGLKPKTRQLV